MAEAEGSREAKAPTAVAGRWPAIDVTHDPDLGSWVEGANGHPDFPTQNLPLGVFSDAGPPRAGVAIGDWIVDLAGAAAIGLVPASVANAVGRSSLNDLLALPAGARLALRRRLSTLLSEERHRPTLEPLLRNAADCRMHLPTAIGDYTDFYAGIHHAENVGRLFRPDAPLLPNYKHVPIGYHGRASSVRVSGAPVRRPNGQSMAAGAEGPAFGPCRRLDYELELAVWIGPGNAPGEPIPIGEAAAHFAGFGLLNDWSARDIQAWEYQPLGPFLAKNFHSTVSPWIVTSEALAPFRIAPALRAEGDPRPLPYLLDPDDQTRGGFAIALRVHLRSARMRARGLPPALMGQSAGADMYWTVAQLVAHHASGGCDLRPGDLIGSGTISAAVAGGHGSLLEQTAGGRVPVQLPTGETRTFLEDGDEVILSAAAHVPGRVAIGFGECSGVVAGSSGGLG